MLKNLFKNISESLFPENFTCDLCGSETFGTNLCPDCKNSVIKNDGNTCPVCGRQTVANEICIECKHSLPLYDKAVSPLVYENGTVKLIQKFKNGNAYLKNYFALLIAEKLENFPDFDLIVYVPSAAKSLRRRGYNQSFLLAQSVSQKTGKPLLKNAVIKTKETLHQKELNGSERAENLKNSFKVAKRSEIKNMRVLVIDDVLTTGATANEISRILIAAGANKVYIAAAASVRYKMFND